MDGTAATDEDDTIVDELTAALMARWGVDDTDEDAYDAARADLRVILPMFLDWLGETEDEAEGVWLPAPQIWLHTCGEVRGWLHARAAEVLTELDGA